MGSDINYRLETVGIMKQTPYMSIKSWALALLLLVCILSNSFATEDGYLRLKSNVDDVTIHVNGRTQEIGQDWAFIELPPGEYTIKASKEHYPTQSAQVSIRPARVSTLTFEFRTPGGFRVEGSQGVEVEKGYGDITIVTDIPGASVRLNGQPVEGEVTPITVKDLAQGQWTVDLVLQGRALSKDVIIEPESLQVIRFFFDPDKYQAAVDSKLDDIDELKDAISTLKEEEASIRRLDIDKILTQIEEYREIQKELEKSKPDDQVFNFNGVGRQPRKTISVTYTDFSSLVPPYPKRNTNISFDLHLGTRSVLGTKMMRNPTRDVQGVPSALRFSARGRAGSSENRAIITLSNTSFSRAQRQIREKINELASERNRQSKLKNQRLPEINNELADLSVSVEKILNEINNYVKYEKE